MSKYLSSNVIEFNSFEEICDYMKGKYIGKSLNPSVRNPEILNRNGIRYFAVNFNDIFRNSAGIISIVDVDFGQNVSVGIVGAMNSSKQLIMNSAEIQYDNSGHIVLFVPMDSYKHRLDDNFISKYKMEVFAIVFDNKKIPDWINIYFAINIDSK